MTVNDLISICEPVETRGERPSAIGSLTQDSRKVSDRSAFIAVRGIRTDGHLFIKDAVARGAAAVICEDPSETDNLDVFVIVVEDTQSLLGPLAQAFEGNPARELEVIGITGTNGKTTVATLAYQVLRKLGARPSLLGTAGKRILNEIHDSILTTADPVELASDMHKMVEAGSTHLVMEISSHALDQQRIDGIPFRVAAFTNLSHDHLDYHETEEAYASAKKKLFERLTPDAAAIVNGDDAWHTFMTEDCRAEIIRFGMDEEADVQFKIISSTQQGLELDIGGQRVTSPLVGGFNAYNITCAYLICKSFGFDSRNISAAFESSTGAAGRLERVIGDEEGEQPLVLVDYAHTPDALRNVLDSLRDLKQKSQNLHVIFGCGGDRDRSKRPEMAQIAEEYADSITVTSDNPRSEDPESIIDEIMEGFSAKEDVFRITDRRKAIHHAIDNAGPREIILIAGKGHETYQEIDGERYDFDDRKVALEALGSRNGNPKAEVH